MLAGKTRFFQGGWGLLFCGLLALTGFFLVPGQRTQAATPAFVRIIHASPFVGTADIFVDGTPFLTSFAFGAVTDYAAVPPGPHKVQLALVGKGIGGAALTETLSVQPGGVYTVAAIGASADSLSLQVFNDNNIAAAGTAKVRMYQLIPDGGWISVVAAGRSSGASYQGASNYLTLAPGSTSFNLDAAQAGGTLSLTTALQANTVTSIFAVGMFNGAPKAELVAKQTAALPGLPQTGSDPFAFIADGRLSTPWLLLALALIAVGGTFFTRRLFTTH